MTAREFTIDDLDRFARDRTSGRWILVDGMLAVDTGDGIPRFLRLDGGDACDDEIATAAPDLAAFARRLLTERDEARERLLRAWGEASRWCHGEDCPARLRDDEMDRDTAGATMNNVCFRTREEAWDYIGRNLDAQEAFVARDLAETRRRLAELHAKAAEVVEARHRYRQARERDGGARG